MAARQWTVAQRQRQAEIIRQWKPWEHSTGAKTVEGKSISAKNAYEGGQRSMLKELARYLREQKNIL